jgi:DNA-binding NarL/FixJ family response regulator
MPIGKKLVQDEAGRITSPEATVALTLTPREVEVLKLQAHGLLYKEIAAKLHVSEHTVHNYLYALRQKLHAHNAMEAVNAATRLGLLLLK